MKKIVLSIEGMSCSACSIGLEKYLKKQKGIIDVSVNLVMAEALITYEDNLTEEDLAEMIKKAGFKSLGNRELLSKKEETNGKGNLIFFTILTILVLYISMSHMVSLPQIPYLNMMKYSKNYAIVLFFLSIPYLIYGIDILKSGVKNLFHQTPNMDTLVTIGVSASFLYSIYNTVTIFLGKNMNVENLYYESVCTVIYFIKLGRYIDQKSKKKTKSAIEDLVQITPTKAYRKEKDEIKEITIDEVKVGDILVCQSGMKASVDGIITEGEAYFDESFLTGESKPIKKKKGDSIMAGSLNIDGEISYQAKKIGKDSTISEMVHLVIEATNSKAPIALIADKVSSIFVPIVIIIAIITFILYLGLEKNLAVALIHFVTVLVVACPCALGLATPLAIVISEGLCAKQGILVKSSEVLENVSKVQSVVFDKTGTLTYGKLKIDKFYNESTYSDQDFLEIISALEKSSSHPISSAFQQYNSKKYLVKDYQNIAGIGFSAKINKNEYAIGNRKILQKYNLKNPLKQKEEELAKEGNSIIYIIENNKIIGLIGVKDILRESSKEVISLLKQMNKKVIMLTGDNQLTANVIASSLDVDEVVANVMPKEKENYIKNLKSTGKVMMVGDGINDAPSLVSADIGISISSATDIASSAANVILMNDNLLNIINLFIISKKTISNIKQNLFWAFLYNICMIPLAIGIFPIKMNPMIGSFAMTLSSLSVVLNALRLKRIALKSR